MRYKIAWFIVMFLLVLNLSAFASLYFNKHVRSHPNPVAQTGCSSIDFMQRYLELTGEQLHELHEIRMVFEKEKSVIQADMTEKRRELLHEVRMAEPSAEKIDQTIGCICEMQRSLQKLSIKNMLKEKEILSESQRTKLYDAMESWCCSHRVSGSCDRGESIIEQKSSCGMEYHE